MTDVADSYRGLAATLSRTVESVPPERWGDKSPCEGWTARDVLKHLVDGHSTMAGHVGLTLPAGPSVDTGPVAAWAQTREAMQAILDDPTRADLEYDSYFGRTTLASTIGTFMCFDLVVHRWDIARATGVEDTIPEADIEQLEGWAAQLGGNLRLPGVCGPPVEVSEDADRQTRLLAFLGRRV